ncbi:2Fe-2S iron-sulfur cluster-binding protein [Pseudomonas sp. BJa5]|uniref:2Fe-2S iron-sulfur cluster-binding protein n=1 Tax=Pseudomonas sp. BJa5 TaxID=2936270 RepID=UPI003858A036
MGRYHEEAFVAQVAPVSLRTTEGHQVNFSRSGHSVRVAPGETLHAAAGRVGLHIPKACGMGLCGTCRVLKLSGEVTMTHQGGISDEELAEGYVLSCCGIPQGDVTLDC